MSSSVASALPASFAAGTTVDYLRVLAGFDPAEWTVTLYLAGPSTHSQAGVAEGEGHRVTLDAADTANLVAGTYRWVHRAEKSGVKCDVESGTVIVTPDLAQASDGDYQTWAEKTLPVVEAAIAQQLPAGLQSYQIAGRAVSKIPLTELLALRADLAAVVESQRNPGKVSRTIRVSFPPVGS